MAKKKEEATQPDQPKKKRQAPQHKKLNKSSLAMKVLAKAMQSMGMSTREISNKLNISNGWVSEITRASTDQVENELVTVLKKSMSGKLAMINSSIMERLLDGGTEGETAEMRDMMVSLGIGIEKQRLIDGDSTSNVFNILQLQNQVDAQFTKAIEAETVEPIQPARLEESPTSLKIPSPESATVPLKKGKK